MARKSAAGIVSVSQAPKADKKQPPTPGISYAEP